MKIKDIKGIAEKFPVTEGYKRYKGRCLEIDIDANECCEVDAKKLVEMVIERMCIGMDEETIVKVIAKAGIIKWKEKK